MTTGNKRQRLAWTLAGVLGLTLIYNMGTTVMGANKVEQLTAQMKTLCVGRFLIDLPATMEFSYSHTFIYGFWVTAIPESPEAFLQRVAEREAEINSQPNERGYSNMEKVQPIDKHGLTGKIFTFGRTTVEGQEDGEAVHYVNVALEGYVHRAGTTFTFKAEEVAPSRTDVLEAIIDKVRIVAPDEIPSAPGFCFGKGMLVDPIPLDWTEGVAMFAGFRGQPDLALAFNTRAGLGKDPNDPGRLARNARSDAEMPLWQRPLLKKLRIGERVINGLAGEEVLERGLELNFIPVYTFDWEVGGTKDNALVPAMHLEMSTGHSAKAGAPPVLSFLSEEGLIQLWDKISSSIRVRPTNPGAPIEATPPGPRLGDSTTAGDICPESGWWQCTDSAANITVLGGPQQFFRKGQQMPQALLLPKQTPWERIRRVQPSFEYSQPTGWTLTDRRARARVNPDVALALPSARTTAVMSDELGGQRAPAELGQLVSTGAPCPASGWWQCQDFEALDGSRWFTCGEVFPAATFQLPSSSLTWIYRDVRIIQRRTTWKLVRRDSKDETKG